MGERPDLGGAGWWERMADIKHTNLHAHMERSEVYRTFQRDYNTDSWKHGAWHAALLFIAIGAAAFSGRTEWLWLFGGMYATERAITRFIDMSNRNWAMHVIDWIESNRSLDRDQP